MVEWNYADLWESVADSVPDRAAQIRGDRVVAWSDFDRRADGLARGLLDGGLTRQSKVAAYLYNAPEYLETYFAAFKAGLVPVNTNYRYVADELIYLFDNADAEAVVFHASLRQRWSKFAARCRKSNSGSLWPSPAIRRPRLPWTMSLSLIGA